jgi:hypothetical protein
MPVHDHSMPYGCIRRDVGFVKLLKTANWQDCNTFWLVATPDRSDW